MVKCEQVCAFLVLAVFLGDSSKTYKYPRVRASTKVLLHRSESRNINHHCVGSEMLHSHHCSGIGDPILAFLIIATSDMKPLPYFWAMVSYVTSAIGNCQQHEGSFDIRDGDDVLYTIAVYAKSPFSEQRQQALSP